MRRPVGASHALTGDTTVTPSFWRYALSAAIVLCLLVPQALAEPYNGKEFTYRQPDGTTFDVRLWGDEFFAYQETVDGYLVVRDKASGDYCYARAKADGTEIISTGVKVGLPIPPELIKHERLSSEKAFNRSRELRNLLGRDSRGRLLPTTTKTKANGGLIVTAPPSFPTTNVRVGLVLLASFPDRQADITISRAQIDAYCNAPDYTDFQNATSVQGYFDIQSNGKLRYNLTVTAYFTAANNRDYYTDPLISYGTRARELIREGLDVLNAAGFDFTQCDANGDNTIDGVNCFYAGDRANSWAEGLWPHMSGTSWSGFSAHGLNASFAYQITEIGTSLSIGTFCHENGHMLCDFPDLYSYNGNAAKIDNFSLMASSSAEAPANIDPYLKLHAGWSDIVDLDQSSHQQCAVQANRNHVFRYRNPDNIREYFLFELRHNTGYEGAYGGASGSVNPASGLVVYHALETGANTYSSIFTSRNPTNSYTQPYELLVVEASPPTIVPWYDDPTPNSSDAFHAGGNDELSDSTFPALKFWTTNGRTSNSYCHVHSVSAIGPSMTFVVGTGALGGSPVIGMTVTALEPTADLGTDAAAHTFGIYNAGGGTLSYSISDDAAWLTVSPVTGTVTTECALVDVTYDTDAMSSGTYGATITVTDAAAANSPQTIPVTLTIASAPGILLSTNAVRATLAPGSGSVAYFEVRNGGGGTMDYTLTENLTWLNLDSTGGSVAAESDRIAVEFGDWVPSGTYNGTITVTAPNAPNSPQTVSASLIVTGAAYDFGDLSASYALTVLSDNGARHLIPGAGSIYLGTAIDGDADGQESTSADGDDTSGGDDEDGITVVGTWREGTDGGSVQVVVNGAGYLSAWIDWNRNDSFVDASDHVLDMEPVSTGTQTNTFTIPVGAIPTSGVYTSFARFRLWTNSVPALTTTGEVVNGEIEDHMLQFTGENLSGFSCAGRSSGSGRGAGTNS